MYNAMPIPIPTHIIGQEQSARHASVHHGPILQHVPLRQRVPSNLLFSLLTQDGSGGLGLEEAMRKLRLELQYVSKCLTGTDEAWTNRR